MAYPLQGYLIGWFVEKQEKRSSTLFLLFLCAIFLQLGLGSLWLSLFVGIDRCFLLGFWPFLSGEMAKAFCVITYLKLIKKRGV